jgi:phosphoenolpyruvate phosphomutase
MIGDTATGSPLRALSAHNAIAARAAADAGCEALWVSGLEVSASLGLPDTNVLTVHDMIPMVSAIRSLVELPVVVDVDNAGGSVDSAVRYGRELSRAGVAAVCLEDSAYPKCNSFSTRRHQRLADPELVCEQIAALRSAAADLLIIGRTEALICGAGLAEALTRAEVYASAGADMALVHSKDPSGAEALAVARAWQSDVPLAVVPTAFPSLTWRDLGDAGFRMCIYANQLSRAAAAAMRQVAMDIMTAGTVGEGTQMSTVDELLRLADPENAACL